MDVIITMLADRAVFPLTMSVSAGVVTPAGIAVSSNNANARLLSNKLTVKKNNTGITAIFIMTIKDINL